MAPPTLPYDIKRLRNTRPPSRKSRQKPTFTYRSDGTLPDDQRVLLHQLPEHLGDAGRSAYLAAARGAPWIGAINRGLLAAYAVAVDTCSTASGELDRLMRDPAFADPTSEAAKPGVLYQRVIARQTTLILDMARVLGLSPKGRSALGIQVNPPPPSAYGAPH